MISNSQRATRCFAVIFRRTKLDVIRLDKVADT